MSTYKVDFEMLLRVKFESAEAVKAYFIDGKWKETFYTFEDMNDLVSGLAYAFNSENDHWDSEQSRSVRSIEGYGIYVRQELNKYCLNEVSAREIGSQITITIVDQLDVQWVMEEPEPKQQEVAR